MMKKENKAMHLVKLELLIEKLQRAEKLEKNITATGIFKGSAVVFEMLREDLYKKYDNLNNVSDEDLDRDPYITKRITFDDYESIKDDHPFGMEIDEFLGTEDLTGRKPKESPEISFGIYRYKLYDELSDDSKRNLLCQKDDNIYYSTDVLCQKDDNIYYSTDVLCAIADSFGFDVKFGEMHSEQIPYPGSVVPLALGGNKSIKGFGYIRNSYTITLTARIDQKHYAEDFAKEFLIRARYF